jgi:hypothetical protein
MKQKTDDQKAATRLKKDLKKWHTDIYGSQKERKPHF